MIGVPPDSRDAFFIAMGQPELALDERFLGLLASREDLTELFERLNPVFKEKTTKQWCLVLREMGVRYAPVRDYAGTVADQGAWINGYFQKAIDERGETLPIVGTPIKMSATPLTPSAQVPELGQHTDLLLRAQGYTDEQIADWRYRNVI